MKKLIVITVLLIGALSASAKEPNFNIVGSSSISVTEVEFPMFVGSEASVKKDEPKNTITETRPPKPAGDGWQWDNNKKHWWKYSTYTPTYTFYSQPQSYCVNGKCYLK